MVPLPLLKGLHAIKRVIPRNTNVRFWGKADIHSTDLDVRF